MSATKAKPVAVLWAEPGQGVKIDCSQISRLSAHTLRLLMADVRFIAGTIQAYLDQQKRIAAVTGRRQLTRRGMPARKAQL